MFIFEFVVFMLFGYVCGVFMGVVLDCCGLLILGDGGMVFFDEVVEFGFDI